MVSAMYKLFVEAMKAHRPIICIYKGYPRAICPIILGHTDEAEKALIEAAVPRKALPGPKEKRDRKSTGTVPTVPRKPD